jgi:alpha-aminoadipate carrier protein LysW
MSIKTVSGTAPCPECAADVSLSDVMQNEITQCAECGADLEVTSIDPIELSPAPEEEEDWGE